MQPDRVLLIGDHDRPELREAVAWLEQNARVVRAGSVSSALAAMSGVAQGPDAIVLAQTCPGRLGRHDVERLHRQWPFARLIALLGSWCEGETRSGQPWPGVLRVYWHQWVVRCERELGRAIRSGRSSWSLPRTATEAERLLRASRTPLPQGRGLVAIRADRCNAFEALADACRLGGYASVWLPPRQRPRFGAPTAVLWDGVCCDRLGAESIGRLVAAYRPAPLAALLDFVRLDDDERARAAGAAAVLAKPFLLEDLLGAIQQAVRQAGLGDPTVPAA